jgi:uncharacterized protein YcsI (UPF0317 family)
LTPIELRTLIRNNQYTKETAGECDGYAQANLIMLSKEYAYDFLLFAQRNPKACPLLEVTNPGETLLHYLGKDINISTDIPKYRIYEDGILIKEVSDITSELREDLVSFLIGCSFSFEWELMEAGIPIRHIEQQCNVPMYQTNIPCEPAGVFFGNMVVSMRPVRYQDLAKVVQITAQMPRVHGAPVHIGSPEVIGIKDINSPDFGDFVLIKDKEVPVFWPCGVTPQSVVMSSKPSFAITHAPGHMLVTDIKNADLKY